MHPQQPQCWLTQEAASILSAQPWPGNIRQLQNVVERLVVMRGGGAIGVEHLPSEFLSATGLVSQHPSHPFTAKAESITNQNLPRNNAGQRVEARSEPLTTRGPFPTGTGLSELNPRPGVTAMQLPADFGVLPAEGINLIEFIENLENSLITQALQRTDNNRNQAARLLGMNRTTLVERIKKRKLSPMNPASEEL
jgi:sigma-54 specific flagellar transcriptional regulator A